MGFNSEQGNGRETVMKRSAKDRRGVLNLFSSHFEDTFFLNEALKEMQAAERRRAAEMVRTEARHVGACRWYWTKVRGGGECSCGTYNLADRIESGE